MHDNHVDVRKALRWKKYRWPFYAWGLQRSDVIFVQHEGQRARLPTRWQGRAYSLPGIVPVPEVIVPHSERNGAVVWVAVIRPAKRPDRLIEIARQLPMIRFVVCGSPSMNRWDPVIIEGILTQLRSLQNVDYRGHVAAGEILKTIGHASLLLSTSDGEGFPSVFLEAWAAGTPVVSVQIDPDHKILNHELGMVTDTVDGAVEAVRSLMASPERRKEMGMRARRHVEELHSPSGAVRVFETAVARVSTARPAGVLQEQRK
jgi:glycosyltransferase involved in cell wall biosynthesis